MFRYLLNIASNSKRTIQIKLFEYNRLMDAKQRINGLLKVNNIPELNTDEDKAVKEYFRSKGYKLNHTKWHAYYKAMTGELHLNYIPLGLFNTKLSPKLNQRKQWPALLDKNLLYRIFDEFNQPKCIAQNINGFYYIDNQLVNEIEVINAIENSKSQLIIKPSIESGRGRNIISFSYSNGTIDHNDLSIEELLKRYKKDFIIQEFLPQSEITKKLNSTSLNTLRIVSYLNSDGVHMLATAIRIGALNATTDNYATGGIICGIDDKGQLKSKGFTKKGHIVNETFTGIKLGTCKIPNYDKVLEMVRSMHKKIPYFKLVSWDIALNDNDNPVLIEYNTYNQGLEIQLISGPLFGEFTEEVLQMGRED